MNDITMRAKSTPAPALAPTDGEIIRVERVKKHYGDVEILKGVDLTVSAGQFTAIMGKSGSGKSTLLGIIAGLEQPDEGDVFIMGNKLAGMSDNDMATLRRRSIGIVFQGFSLIPSLTALDNVMLPTFFATETSAEQRRQRGVDLLKQVGLSERLHYHPATLSGGEQQRVAIARALAMRPKVLLFDEPTSALDPETIGDVLEVMRRLAREHTTMIVVTHELGFAQGIAERILFMDLGEIVEEGPSQEMLTRPRSARLAAFLDAVIHK
jgi:ABC-type polar amino acid transport system ATPase subunit